MNLPIDTTDGCAFALRVGYDAKCYAANVGLGGGTSRQHRCAWCINAPNGIAGTILAHYHKAGTSNVIGTTFSTQETAVMTIWEV